MDENVLTEMVEGDLNATCKKVEDGGQIFAALAIFGLRTEEDDVIDHATVSLSYSKDLPRETQRAMLQIAHKLIGSMLGE